MQIEIVGSYSGKINAGEQYESQAPFNSVKLILECAQDEMTAETFSDTIRTEIDRLNRICYEAFLDWRQQTHLDMNVYKTGYKWWEHDNTCNMDEMEQIRLKAIELVKEHGKWFKKTEQTRTLRAEYKAVTGIDLTEDIDNLPFGLARQLDRRLFHLKHKLQEAA